MTRYFCLVLLVIMTVATDVVSQSAVVVDEQEKKLRIRVQGDNRRTLVDKNGVNLFGLRAGVLVSDRVELGLGIYSTNLFGIIGSSVSKRYVDNSISAPNVFDSQVGFQYVSVYGDYSLFSNKRLRLSAIAQVGFGSIMINFPDVTPAKEGKRVLKSLIEPNLKLEVQTLPWLTLAGGIGYRYLPRSEQQIQKAFNNPIFIVGIIIDFNTLFGKTDSIITF